MPTTIVLHSQEIALLIAGIVSLVIYAAIWISVSPTAATARKRPLSARLKAPFAKMVASYRRRTYSGRHWATA